MALLDYILVGIIVTAIVTAVIFLILQRKKHGCGSCGCCSDCSGCCHSDDCSTHERSPNGSDAESNNTDKSNITDGASDDNENHTH